MSIACCVVAGVLLLLGMVSGIACGRDARVFGTVGWRDMVNNAAPPAVLASFVVLLLLVLFAFPWWSVFASPVGGLFCALVFCGCYAAETYSGGADPCR